MKWIAALLLGASLSAHAYNKELVAAVLIAEAGGEKDPRAMHAVMEVIRNRAEQKGKNFEQIVVQKWQFSCLNGIKPENLVAKAKRHAKFSAAMAIVNGPRTNYTKGATHYFADHIAMPSWAAKMTRTVKIENHIFFK